MALCEDPYMDGNAPRPCGRCLPCLKGRSWRWTSRIILETFNHDHNAFITLTYSDKYLPDQHPDTDQMVYPTVNPIHLQKFIKRLRKIHSKTSDTKLRYYAIGEYGTQTWRPHYHLALFGYPHCLRGQTKQNSDSCCPPCDNIKKAWTQPTTKEPLGRITNDPLEPASSAYIAGYITKKLHKPENGALLGRYPEFSRMSRRPGLGALSMQKIAPTIATDLGQEALTEHKDVPTQLNFGNQQLVIDRYLRQTLRKNLEMEEIYDQETGEIFYKAQVQANQAFEDEMQDLYLDAVFNEDGTRKKTQPLTRKHFILDKDRQKIKNQHVKHKLKIQKQKESSKL